MIDTSQLIKYVEQHPYPLVFATISGAHLYGFPSPDSDFDLRGVHLLPLEQVIGLDVGEETVEKEGIDDGLEIDLVTHDARKFFALMLKKNGYVLEQVSSPLIVHTTPAHEELKAIAADCVTRHHAHHYLGFARNQWRMFGKEPRVKTLLYVYRVLLTGIHLMRSGELQASLPPLLDEYPQPGVAELLDQRPGPGLTLLAIRTIPQRVLKMRRQLRAHLRPGAPAIAHLPLDLPDVLDRAGRQRLVRIPTEIPRHDPDLR